MFLHRGHNINRIKDLGSITEATYPGKKLWAYNHIRAHCEVVISVRNNHYLSAQTI